MTTHLHYDDLPDGVEVEIWNDEGDTYVVVNKNLPAKTRRAALRAALQADAVCRPLEALLPTMVLATLSLVRAWARRHPAKAMAMTAATSAAVVLALAAAEAPTRAPAAHPWQPAPASTTLSTETVPGTSAPRKSPPSTGSTTRPAAQPVPSTMHTSVRLPSWTALDA
ncbi:hypothetical protein Ssi03_61920 [Sphaerisporangium siamense]|uniref:Uncharacterized protein n=1 Tax=Sphaerisporangium siamense TaxID=795645 RepID=A0A7W7GBJ8_9ACTN|nr:hypothetical protein [Sphaerisporangium siamense]MBB4702504.1 hypothetical protein [Sphaerisporangium siamense]GII88202.1 hypothetical protein Ssi03_61920 [Sphaerisporangium siamense]